MKFKVGDIVTTEMDFSFQWLETSPPWFFKLVHKDINDVWHMSVISGPPVIPTEDHLYGALEKSLIKITDMTLLERAIYGV